MAITQTGTATASPRPAPGSNTSTGSNLIQRIARGDQLAMRTLFARHHMRLYRFLVRVVHDRSIAEDLLSDVFLDVWRQAAEFEGRSSVSTWLLAIGRSKRSLRCGVDMMSRWMRDWHQHFPTPPTIQRLRCKRKMKVKFFADVSPPYLPRMAKSSTLSTTMKNR
jgi:sigma-70-like protein